MTVAEFIPTYTPEDLLRMPDNSTLELVDGQIVEKQVSAESSKIEGRFYFSIQLFLLSHPVAEVYPGTLGYRCFKDDPSKIRKPDASVISLERLNALADRDPGYMPIMPDLAIEVISPNDVVYAVDQKIREYLDAGFPLVWLADPAARTVTVYPGNGRPVIHRAQDELTAEAVLPGFRCKVADFFPALVETK